MLEVDDCFVIADTLRFFSENNGTFCLHIETFLPTQARPLSAKTNILGMSGTVSTHILRQLITRLRTVLL